MNILWQAVLVKTTLHPLKTYSHCVFVNNCNMNVLGFEITV